MIFRDFIKINLRDLSHRSKPVLIQPTEVQKSNSSKKSIQLSYFLVNVSNDIDKIFKLDAFCFSLFEPVNESYTNLYKTGFTALNYSSVV